MKLPIEVATEPQKRILEAAAVTARESGAEAWLVGGPVRDTLLGRPFDDLDFAVPAGAETWARALATRLDGVPTFFPEFLTARIRLSDGTDVDVVTTRAEAYRTAGALPTVRPGSLKDDLFRRDFTVNAMALGLESGEITDPFGGRRDLEAREMRILHERSFEDDPTRVLRGLRLACRLGFGMEEATAAFLSRAIAGGAMETVSPERIWREVKLAFGEKGAAAAVDALAAAGALDRLIQPTREEASRLRCLGIAQRLSDQDPALDRFALFAAALFADGADPAKALAGSGADRRSTERVRRILAREQTAGAGSGPEALERAPAEVLAILELHPSAGADARVVRRSRGIDLPFRAGELGIEPGPHLGHALRATRLALARGEIDPSAAAAFARAKALEYLRISRPD